MGKDIKIEHSDSSSSLPPALLPPLLLVIPPTPHPPPPTPSSNLNLDRNLIMGLLIMAIYTVLFEKLYTILR